MKRLLTLILTLGTAAAGYSGDIKRTTPAIDPRPLVWVVDGAGGMGGCSSGLNQANLSAGNPVEVTVFEWTHGKGHLILDQIDAGHSRRQGCVLAAKIEERRALEPGRRMVIVSHSAGSAVTLAASERLPANAIDRIVLLAPSVSSDYDVGPALRSSREGIDVFGSKKDWLMLGIGVRLVGTADRRWGPAAGRIGFRSPTPCSQCGSEANGLRQYFWSSDLAWTGYNGRHMDVYAPTFLETYVFSLIVPRVP